MMITWLPTDTDMIQCDQLFEEMGIEDALLMTHKQLAEKTGLPTEQWRRFLTHPKVVQFLDAEESALIQVQKRRILMGVNKNDRSVGAAQMLSTLNKIDSEGASNMSGSKIFIYSYVPLNKEEQKAPEIRIMDEDIFKLK